MRSWGSQTTCQVGNQDFLSYHTSCSKEIVIFDALADQEGDKGFGPIYSRRGDGE